MSSPLVSIIIPCYRQAHFLAGAIESTLSQSYSAIETVVVNDGSDDETPSVAQRFAGAIRYIERPNGGLSAARNSGIREAMGKYLLFLDADDLLHREAGAWLVEGMEGREDLMVAMGGRFFRNEPDEPDTVEWQLRPLSQPFPELIHTNVTAVHGVLVSRAAVLAAGGFDETMASCEDWDLWARLALAGVGLKTIARAGAFYRRSPNSMSSNTARMLQMRAEVLLHVHQGIVRDGNLLAALGDELLRAEQRVIRRLIAQNVRVPQLAALTQGLRELERLGFRRRRSLPKRLLDAVLGDASEFLAMTYLRLFDSKHFAAYQAGHN